MFIKKGMSKRKISLENSSLHYWYIEFRKSLESINEIHCWENCTSSFGTLLRLRFLFRSFSFKGSFIVTRRIYDSDMSEMGFAMQFTLHKKWSFPLRISSVNVTKSAVSFGFGHIDWRNTCGKLNFLCSGNCWLEYLKSLSGGTKKLKHFVISNEFCSYELKKIKIKLARKLALQLGSWNIFH